ncbi:MAG: FecR domain-containing protein [Bacteroidales bacterium]|nr:FecR domain-containing protein [Bacteroidales bacterium]MCF8388842.1 FecR domain-containing protein [Bacteroidales bacterium]MCF8398457.1 FecR domain-containing protein [Bacteroidales bacterium]
MKKDQTYYHALMDRYFSGEATETDISELAEWVRSHKRNEKQFEEYRHSWMAVNSVSIDKSINTETAWSKLRERMSAKTQKKVPLWKDRRLQAMAAGLLILTGLFFILQYLVFPPSYEKLVAEDGILEVELPDGSRVSLKQNAVLEYANDFSKEKREVNLHGKAFFEVEPDKDRPFIVSCKKARIQVLGTSFLVGESHEDKVEVVLQEGKLSVYLESRPSGKMIMQADDRVEISLKQQKILKKPNTDPNYLSWKTKDFVFNDVALADVVQLLEEVYNTRINLSGKNLTNCRLNASFQDQSLSSILKVLQATFDLKISRTKDQIRIEGEGCK